MLLHYAPHPAKYFLRGANLGGVKNLSRSYQSLVSILGFQKGKLRAFKYLNGNESPYRVLEYKVGKTYKTDNYDEDIFNECGEGLNIATLDWCLLDTDFDLTKTYIEVEFDAKDIVCIPYLSDGKFRVKKLKVIKKLTKKYLKEYIKSV